MTGLRVTGIALLVGGIIMLYFGWQASESLLDQTTEALTGRYTEQTIWYFIGGGVAVVAGLLLASFGGQKGLTYGHTFRG